MQTERLTLNQKRLLERHHDGHALGALEIKEVEALLSGSEVARQYKASLEEVTLAVQASEEVRWDEVSAKVPTGEEVAQSAESAGSLLDAPLEDLWELLQRYHDDEVIEQERAEVDSLRAAREDVSDYLRGLALLSQGVALPAQDHVDTVDFSGFWSGIEARLGEPSEDSSPLAPVIELPAAPTTLERQAFEADDHQVLLYRCFDGEVTAEESAQVAAWAEVDPSISGLLGALEELNLAVNVAVEQAQERVDLSGLWAGVEAQLPAQASEGVVDLGARREQKQGFLGGHRRELVAAFAAAICTVIGVGLFSDKIFGPTERVVIEKRVVIVDSLEYGAGASVVVTGAMEPASLELEAEGLEESQLPSISGDESDAAEKPSPVIWLIDEEEEPTGNASEEKGAGKEEEKDDSQGRRGPI